MKNDQIFALIKKIEAARTNAEVLRDISCAPQQEIFWEIIRLMNQAVAGAESVLRLAKNPPEEYQAILNGRGERVAFLKPGRNSA